MKCKTIVLFLLFTIGIVAYTYASEPRECKSCQHGVVARCQPDGGWFPYGGPLNWWPCCCYPHCGMPDDYCRKPLPCVCWPSYQSFYTWGTQELCPPGCSCPLSTQ